MHGSFLPLCGLLAALATSGVAAPDGRRISTAAGALATVALLLFLVVHSRAANP